MAATLNSRESATADAAAPRSGGTPSRRRSERQLFLRNFLRHPAMVGTLSRSSRAVVRRILSRIDFTHTEVLVELGPGVGTITLPMLERLRPDARLVAIETNPEFVAHLRETVRDPRLHVVQGSATALPAILRGLGVTRVDAVVSGIPFSVLAPAVRDHVLRAVRDALRIGGRLVVYQYSGKVVPHLERAFGAVESGIELRNLVPMRLYRCTKRLPR